MPVISCIEEHPTTQTIKLGGRYISLRRLQAYTGIDEGYLSRMMNGKRDPTLMKLGVALQIAAALGMSIDELIEALLERARYHQHKEVRSQLYVDYMETQQNQRDLANARIGLPPQPRIPLSD